MNNQKLVEGTVGQRNPIHGAQTCKI